MTRWCFLAAILAAGVAGEAMALEPARVESVTMAPVQPHAADKAVIWYDPFDRIDPAEWKYLEPAAGSPQAKLSEGPGVGGVGHAMECLYAKGSQGVGNRKIVFGDSPIGRPLRKGEKFDDVYWRIYVKHQPGWTGDPAKMSRATGMVSSRWNQAFILHVWGARDVLTLDPVSGVRDGQVVTTKYNDFEKFKWLGNSPKGKFPIHSTAESGRWVCVEARLKLNTPGKKDGYSALWVDGRLDAERNNMDFRGTVKAHTINAIFLEAYWNQGSPVEQRRWYDDFVVSTRPIGPVTATGNPALIKVAVEGATQWEAEIAADAEGIAVVWRSKPAPAADGRIEVSVAAGSFAGPAAGKQALPGGAIYFCRARQRDAAGAWSEWSGWHQPFAVASR